MNVLVAYATRHGSTRGIAERIAATLGRRGLIVTVVPVTLAPDPARFDAVVVGGAAYAFHWLKEASRFVSGNRATLGARPTWLFSSGPLGDQPDPDGEDPRKAAEPPDFARLATEIGARDCRVFFGAYNPAAAPIGLMERITRAIPAARDALPAGDFRDWADIEAWAEAIADALAPAEGAAPPRVIEAAAGPRG